MSANPQELFAAYTGLTKPPVVESVACPERRRRPRTKVHWSVVLFRNSAGESGAVESLTQNLSSGGFYCFSGAAFHPGEEVICALKIPTHDPPRKHALQNVECRARVIRVEPDAARGLFGIACRIEDYRFSPR